ncbi:MAG: MBOAT family protein [Candidatus Azobacteroides sp.]|nr:MBOAT family protein [Candidatus Azobacteroides sp.]
MDITGFFRIEWDKLPDVLSYDRYEPLIFSSGLFLFFFLVFTFGYYLLRNKNLFRILYTIFFSCYFYYKTSGIFVLLLLAISVSDFIIARRIYYAPRKKDKKAYLILSLLIDLGMLGYFKYADFFGQIIADLTHSSFLPFDIFLPIGISFFTFQSLSYTIDMYRGKLTPLRHWHEYAFFVTFFPQLVAGPIVRAKDFLPQIRKKPEVTKEMFGTGIFLITGGLFKKAVISDYISLNFVDRIFETPALYSGVENLIGVYGYALQIYCDFSGYSDIAIGLALLLGFRFRANFDSPYKSSSISEFWRRWHISLSTWLRDYLYIPLGGNRKGKIRTQLNIMITMLLGGLWHGASPQFLLWGAFHGVALVIHKIYLSFFPGTHREESKTTPFRKIAGIIFTFHLVCFGWIFFRADDAEKAFEVLYRIFNHFQPEHFISFIQGYKNVCLLMLLGFTLHFLPDSLVNKCRNRIINAPLVVNAIILALLIIGIMQIKSAEIQPFIYFQF